MGLVREFRIMLLGVAKPNQQNFQNSHQVQNLRFLSDPDWYIFFPNPGQSLIMQQQSATMQVNSFWSPSNEDLIVFSSFATSVGWRSPWPVHDSAQNFFREPRGFLWSFNKHLLCQWTTCEVMSPSVDMLETVTCHLWPSHLWPINKWPDNLWPSNLWPS